MPPYDSGTFISLQRSLAGRYSLERELGRGGMGIVYLARDVSLDRLVAIKCLPPALASRPDLRAMFLAEARTAAKLAHPNIVPIHAVEEHGDMVCFVMMFVDGDTLGERVRRAGPLSSADLATLLQEVAWAVGHAHAHGVIHRDIKPDNILLERGTGRALVTDFGIARVVQSLDKGNNVPMGTPAYMSPEQARGEPLDGRSDLYALGATAFFAATGRPPFTAANAAGLLVQQVQQPAPPVHTLAPNVPLDLAKMIDRLLAKHPADRPSSGEEVAAAVAAARGSQLPVPAPVRQYLREASAIGGEVGMGLAATAGVAGALKILLMLQGDFMGIGRTQQMVLVLTLLGITALRAWQLVAATRGLRAQGYRHAHVAPALVLDERDDAGPARQGFTARTALVVLACTAASAVGFLLSERVDFLAINVVGWFAGVLGPVIAVRRLFRDLVAGRKGRVWERWLAGGLGRWLFRVAGVGQRAPALPAAEPTVMALGRATEAAFEALTGDQRRQLSEVPDLVARLQADVLRLRAGAAPGDHRVMSAVAGLENLRMDLLRLTAGEGVSEGLTQDLEAARRIADDIRALLDAQREVEADLKRSTSPAPGS